jgi:hypothetical protein
MYERSVLRLWTFSTLHTAGRTIGVGTTVVAPPSEPDWRISRIRLSSWWLAFKKIGKPPHALALRSTSLPR